VIQKIMSDLLFWQRKMTNDFFLKIKLMIKEKIR